MSGSRTIGDRACAAWAHLAQVEALGDLKVLVREDSPLAMPGGVGILRLNGTVTVSVPDAGFVQTSLSLLQSLPEPDGSGASVAEKLAEDPRVAGVVAQASLFFAHARPAGIVTGGFVRGRASDVQSLLDCVPHSERDESGLADVTSAMAMVTSAEGIVLAASGFALWPSEVAHMCVLTHPAHRGRGYGVRAAAVAIADALDHGLLPQWRARPESSKAVARALGMLELGEQVSIRLVP